MNSSIRYFWKKIPLKRKLQFGVTSLVAIILVIVISQRLGTFAESINTVSNVVTFNYDDAGQSKTVLSNTVYTEITTSPGASATPTQTSTSQITSTPPPTSAIGTGSGSSSGSGGSRTTKVISKIGAKTKTGLIKSKFFLIKSYNKIFNKGGPKINQVSVEPNPANPGQAIRFTVDWSAPGDKVTIYVCRGNLLFSPACRTKNWCSYGPKDSSPSYCSYTATTKDKTYNYYYIMACNQKNICSVGQVGNFHVNR